MAIPIIKNWELYFDNPDEGLGSSYERVVINIFLQKLVKHFNIKSALEVPSFGFTGISGINSMDLAKNGVSVTLLDNNAKRVELIKDVWQKCGYKADILFTDSFETIDFKENSFDLSWNFSAMWFVRDLELFLKELTRVTRKVIAIFVPNIYGLGYRFQKSKGSQELNSVIKEENIFSDNIKTIIGKFGWKFWREDFIDCPPWPDIGMPKEKFLNMLGIKIKPAENKQPLTILDYYCGDRDDFYKEMLKYSFVENNFPDFFKKIWSHHKWMIFLPEK